MKYKFLILNMLAVLTYCSSASAQQANPPSATTGTEAFFIDDDPGPPECNCKGTGTRLGYDFYTKKCAAFECVPNTQPGSACTVKLGTPMLLKTGPGKGDVTLNIVADGLKRLVLELPLDYCVDAILFGEDVEFYNANITPYTPPKK